ncbi:envelope stress response membrane protein PspB [Sphingomonas oryzagri]
MEDTAVPIVVCGILFIGLPWIIFHYVTQWKKARGLSIEDENLLDGLHDLARRLDDRLSTIERIVAADNPNWRPGQPDRTREISRDIGRDLGRDADDWQGRA